MRPSALLLWIAFAFALATLGLAVWDTLGDGTVAGLPSRRVVVIAWLMLAVAVALDWSLTRGPGGLSIIVGAPAETFVGEPVRIDLALDGPLPRSPVTLRLDLPDNLDGEPDVPLNAEGRGIARPLAAARGVARIDRVDARWASRLRLLEFLPRFETKTRIAVVPNIRAVRSGAIDLMIREALFGEKQTAFRGEGSEFHQLSEFQFGMDTRAIDWKSTARHRGLMVREMRAEQNHPVVIALDNGHLMRERIADAHSDAHSNAHSDGGDRTIAKVDHQIRAALALAWGVVQSGDLVGLFAFDARPREWLPPAPGRAAFAAIRTKVAELSYRSEQSNHTLALTTLGRRLPRRGLIVVFSDFVDTTTAELLVESAAVLTKRHVLVFVSLTDPTLAATAEGAAHDMDGVAASVSAAQMLAERSAVLDRLSRLGVEVVEAAPGQLVASVLRAYLRIKLAGSI